MLQLLSVGQLNNRFHMDMSVDFMSQWLALKRILTVFKGTEYYKYTNLKVDSKTQSMCMLNFHNFSIKPTI